MLSIDTLLHTRYLIPVEPDDTVLTYHSIAIHQGKIIAILPTKVCTQQYTAKQEYHYLKHIIIPGLINAHTHAAMSLLRGLADDLPLMEWLEQHIWPAEGRWVNPDFVKTGTQLAIAEMIKSGTTCFNDMYFFPEISAHVAVEMGMRAVLGMIVIDMPTVWAKSSTEYLQKGMQLYQQYQQHPLIYPIFSPHAPYSVSDDNFRQLLSIAKEKQIPIHIHLHETAFEVEQSIHHYGQRPIQRLAKLGVFEQHTIAVHMTQLNDEDIPYIKEYALHVVHCPESNLKLASGFCPVAQLIQQGINVAIGTDGAASNNDLDMFSEMRTAALLAKGMIQNAAVLPAYQALKMATINAAKALGIDAITGSLVVGKSADIVAVEIDNPEMQPLYHPVSQLIYAGSRDKVSDVWIAGQQVLSHKKLTTLDQSQLLQAVALWKEKIYPSHDNSK